MLAHLKKSQLTKFQKREAFAKPLMEQPVVRHRLAKAGGQLEMHWSWVESFCYQMTKLTQEEANVKVH